MISFEKLGVRLPYAGRTYIYERDPWREKEINYCCGAAMIVTGEFFPEVSDYVMISYFTDLEPEMITYENAKKIFPPELLDMTARTEEDYISEVKKELGSLKGFLAAHEIMYDYDFFDLPKGTNTDDPSGEEFKANRAASPDLHFLGISSISGSRKAPAPESSHTEPTAGTVELENGRFAVRLTYRQKRYGFECDKDVWWVYHRGGTRLHRIEFSHDTRAGETVFDPVAFLDSIELSDPAVKAEGGAEQNYYGDPPGTEHYEQIL